MKLPLQMCVSTAMLVATAGLVAADSDPPPLYYMVNPETGESWQTSDGDAWRDPERGERTDPQDTYDSHEIDAGVPNFWGAQPFQTSLVDDYEMVSSVTMRQILVTHTFRAGFTGNDGRLFITFYDESGGNQVSSYLVNLTGNAGFNTIVVSFTSDLVVDPKGFIEFRWNDPADTSFGLMEMEPTLGFNDDDFIRDGVNQFNPPQGAYGGISMKLSTIDIPAPGSAAPLALAGFGLLTHRRRR